jgi:hypothetical protein
MSYSKIVLYGFAIAMPCTILLELGCGFLAVGFAASCGFILGHKDAAS